MEVGTWSKECLCPFYSCAFTCCTKYVIITVPYCQHCKRHWFFQQERDNPFSWFSRRGHRYRYGYGYGIMHEHGHHFWQPTKAFFNQGTCKSHSMIPFSSGRDAVYCKCTKVWNGRNFNCKMMYVKNMQRHSMVDCEFIWVCSIFSPRSPSFFNLVGRIHVWGFWQYSIWVSCTQTGQFTVCIWKPDGRGAWN